MLFFTMKRQTCQPSPLYDHSQVHDRQAAQSRLCCCCAPVFVLYAHQDCVSLLCIPKLCSFTLDLGARHVSINKNLRQFYYCVVPPVVTVAHFEKMQALGWNFEVYSPNKYERQVTPSPLLLMQLMLQHYCLCCAMLLLLCYSRH